MKRDATSREALPDCSRRRFAIVCARFYPELGDMLVDGAKRALRDCGVADERVELFEVPGCFELPPACNALAQAHQFDALVALGVVIRGETPHFEYVARECARGLMDVQLRSSTPIGFGVLTTENAAQAQERADPARGDKGYAAAMAAAALVGLTERLSRAGFRRN